MSVEHLERCIRGKMEQWDELYWIARRERLVGKVFWILAMVLMLGIAFGTTLIALSLRTVIGEVCIVLAFFGLGIGLQVSANTLFEKALAVVDSIGTDLSVYPRTMENGGDIIFRERIEDYVLEKHKLLMAEIPRRWI